MFRLDRSALPPPPDDYEQALAWLEGIGGHVVVTSEQGTLVIAVGALGRSAAAIAPSEQVTHRQRAVLEATRGLYVRL